jgi:coatomer subunit beta'
VATGFWHGECFVYTNSVQRLQFLVGDQVSTIHHFDSPVYALGYLQRDSRVYLVDKRLNIKSFGLPITLIQYQTAVLANDLKLADSLLHLLEDGQRNSLARFLESQGLKEQALNMTRDPEHRFELAIELSDLKTAFSIGETLDHESKWRQLGDVALNQWNVTCIFI